MDFFNNKANEMPPKRETALADLRRFAKELRNSKVVSCDRTLEKDFGQICTSVFLLQLLYSTLVHKISIRKY